MAQLPKILFYYLDFGSQGGIGRYIHEVATALARGGRYEPVVVCTQDTPFYHRMQASGVRVIGVPIPWYVPDSGRKYFMKPLVRLLDWPLALHLRRLLAQEQPAVVHVHLGRLENLWFRLLGYPVVYTFHGYGSPFNLRDTHHPLARACIALGRPLFSALVPHLDALLFVSRAEQQRMQAEGFLPRGYAGTVVHNGLSIEELQRRADATDVPALKASLEIPVTAPCVAFINRFDKFKDPLCFIALAEALAHQEPGLHFLMAGSGHLEPAVRQRVADSPIREKFHVLGHRSDVPELLAMANVAICVPRMEGFGFSVLEALAVGTPCVAYATGGIPEVLNTPETRHLLVPTGDREALAATTLAQLRLSPMERGELRHHLRRRAWTFDLAPMTQTLERVYASILESAETGRRPFDLHHSPQLSGENLHPDDGSIRAGTNLRPLGTAHRR